MTRPLPRSAGLEPVRGARAGVVARNMLLATELTTILRAFRAVSVRCAPLRGFDLAERLHGDIAARSMGDLDLLVSKQDLPTVADVLTALGFRAMDRRPGFSEAYSYTLKFIKERHGWVIVEPHWSIAYPPFLDRIDMTAVWQRCRPGRILGVETPRLGDEDLLLHLCLHVAHRGQTAPLRWTWEIARLLRTAPPDWPRWMHLVEATGLGFQVAPVLDDAQRRFDAPLPDEVRTRLQNFAAGTRGWSERLLGSRVDGKESLAVFLALPGIAARLRYAAALLYPSAEFMRLQYGLTRRGQLGPAYVRRLAALLFAGAKGLAALTSPPRPAAVCSRDDRAAR